ncbi:hypothetical protein [Novosphingobium beihaiensis]|uniref:Transcription factor zinc-finger domain-containing protein n=1 Tax=Novosphingobium beihaiensis TaxID=2930389 RepID=A0ABT0BLI1_9SPHN|nr:hypothetical protein [Novosphingobium beihaiensis]MCJ2185916.1 hypothetical protein [Novosphingobium beihaiensis]
MIDNSRREYFNKIREQEVLYLKQVWGSELHHRCPLESEGDLISATITETGEGVFYCDECDSIWRSNHPLDEAHADSFETFALANGRSGLTMDDILIG